MIKISNPIAPIITKGITNKAVGKFNITAPIEMKKLTGDMYEPLYKKQHKKILKLMTESFAPGKFDLISSFGNKIADYNSGLAEIEYNAKNPYSKDFCEQPLKNFQNLIFGATSFERRNPSAKKEQLSLWANVLRHIPEDSQLYLFKFNGLKKGDVMYTEKQVSFYDFIEMKVTNLMDELGIGEYKKFI